MRLTGPDFFEFMGLRRVHRSNLTRQTGNYYDHGNPIPGWLIPDIINGLLHDGLLEMGDPDESGTRPITLTDTGLTHYRALCKRQRHQDPLAH